MSKIAKTLKEDLGAQVVIYNRDYTHYQLRSIAPSDMPSETVIYSADGEVLGHYPEPEDVYFWSSESGIPRSTSSCEWNLELDKQESDDNWECSYCDSLQPLTKYRCGNCGAVRVRG